MYAVIFRAEINSLDQRYESTAARMRELALSDYGCLDFVACAEGDQEIAISYWPSLEHIRAWRDNDEHRQAQASGKKDWYRGYRVQVVEVLRDYDSK